MSFIDNYFMTFGVLFGGLSFKHFNGAFTLSDTETETDIETNKLAQNPTGICDGVHICAV